MDITTYLPDELGERAKRADLNFSRLLRGAVADELTRQDDFAAARGAMVGQEVEATDRDGNPLLLRFIGTHVGGGDPGVYLTESGRVVVVWEDEWTQFDDVEDFGTWVNATNRNQLDREGESIVAGALTDLGGRLAVTLD